MIKNRNIKDLRDVSQLCTKQVGTGEMIRYKKELKNRGNKEVQLKRLKEMIIKYYKSTQGRSHCTRLSKMHICLAS